MKVSHDPGLGFGPGYLSCRPPRLLTGRVGEYDDAAEIGAPVGDEMAVAEPDLGSANASDAGEPLAEAA